MVEKSGEVRQIQVPVIARESTEQAPIDYEDAFRVRLPDPASPPAPRWAEMILEEARADRRRAVLSGWEALGFELGPIPGKGFVLGWAIRRSEPDLVVLATESPLGIAGELVFRREPDGLLYATFVQLHGDVARRAWAPFETAHPPTVRELLRDAAARIPESSSSRRWGAPRLRLAAGGAGGLSSPRGGQGDREKT
jgi:hypothetical protein